MSTLSHLVTTFSLFIILSQLLAHFLEMCKHWAELPHEYHHNSNTRAQQFKFSCCLNEIPVLFSLVAIYICTGILPFYPSLKDTFLHSVYACIFCIAYNDHPRSPKIVALIDRWSFFRCHLFHKNSKWDPRMVVVVGRWSLFRGGC